MQLKVMITCSYILLPTILSAQGGLPIQCWGGDETLAPSPPKGARFVDFDVAGAGGTFACGITEDHRLYCWGDPTSSYNRGTIANYPRETLATQVELGRDMGCILTPEGKPDCWGEFEETVIGVGYPNRSASPPQGLISGRNFDAIYVEGSVACARETDGPIHCWGDVVHMNWDDEVRFAKIDTFFLGGPSACWASKDSPEMSCALNTSYGPQDTIHLSLPTSLEQVRFEPFGHKIYTVDAEANLTVFKDGNRMESYSGYKDFIDRAFSFCHVFESSEVSCEDIKGRGGNEFSIGKFPPPAGTFVQRIEMNGDIACAQLKN